MVIGCMLKKLFAPHLRPRRPLVFSGFPVGIVQEIRHGCQFLHRSSRALGHLPGGLVRFIPCQPSAHYTRLMHVGGDSVDMVSSLALVRVVTFVLSRPLLDFVIYPVGAATGLFFMAL